MNWEKTKNICSIIQSVVTILAILVGGWWFLFQGEANPKANISHKVTHRKLDSKLVWVQVSIKLSNPGKRPVKIQSGDIRIQQILPLANSIERKIQGIERKILKGEDPLGLSKSVMPWPRLGIIYKPQLQVEIASMEHDNLNFEFVIPVYVKTVKIYSYFENQENSKIGWAHTTIYDL